MFVFFSFTDCEEGNWDQPLPAWHDGWRCCWLLFLGKGVGKGMQVTKAFKYCSDVVWIWYCKTCSLSRKAKNINDSPRVLISLKLTEQETNCNTHRVIVYICFYRHIFILALSLFAAKRFIMTMSCVFAQCLLNSVLYVDVSSFKIYISW